MPRRGRTLVVLVVAIVVLAAAILVVRHVDHATAASLTEVAPCPPRAAASTDPPPDGRGPLFARPVSAMIACSYGGRHRSQLAAAVPLGRRLSVELAHDLDGAARTGHDPLQCLTILTFTVLVARDSRGNPLPPVTLVPGCDQITATNGSATRVLDVRDPALREATRFVGSRHR